MIHHYDTKVPAPRVKSFMHRPVYFRSGIYREYTGVRKNDSTKVPGHRLRACHDEAPPELWHGVRYIRCAGSLLASPLRLPSLLSPVCTPRILSCIPTECVRGPGRRQVWGLVAHPAPHPLRRGAAALRCGHKRRQVLTQPHRGRERDHPV
jgi:hypothetical protein